MTTQEPTHITRGLETFFEELKTSDNREAGPFSSASLFLENDDIHYLQLRPLPFPRRQKIEIVAYSRKPPNIKTHIIIKIGIIVTTFKCE